MYLIYLKKKKKTVWEEVVGVKMWIAMFKTSA